jgi:hypothetical protein
LNARPPLDRFQQLSFELLLLLGKQSLQEKLIVCRWLRRRIDGDGYIGALDSFSSRNNKPSRQ